MQVWPDLNLDTVDRDRQFAAWKTPGVGKGVEGFDLIDGLGCETALQHCIVVDVRRFGKER